MQVLPIPGAVAALGNQPWAEDQYGLGTARGHWDDAIYQTELMSGFSEPLGVSSPMSIMTVRSLKDLGFTVDESQADAYSLPPQSRRLEGSEGRRPYGNDMIIPKKIPKPVLTKKHDGLRQRRMTMKEMRESRN